MLFLVITWSFLLIVSFQIGSTILDMNKGMQINKLGDRFIISTWIGIIITSNIFLAISVFNRLSLLVALIVFFGCTLVSILLSRKIYIGTLWPYLSPGIVLGFIALLISISFVSTQVVTWYDTGLYHFGAIKWLSRYGAVPGVALVYYALGYASSWFALTAPFNNWILDGRISTITGGLAFLLLIMHLWICLIRIFTKRAEVEDWFLVISSLLASVVITRFEIYVSPSTDLPVIILTIVTAWSFVIIRKQNNQISSNRDHHIKVDNGIIPLILSAGAVSIKLSAIPILLIAGVFYLSLKKISIRRILVLVSIVSLILMPFFMFQAITSGCLLYPSSLFCLDLPWTIDAEKIKEVSEQIAKAAQWHMTTPPKGKSWSWFLPWLVREKFQTGLIFLAVITCIFAIKKLRNGRLYWAKWPLTMGALGFLYTMVMGPTWRYSLGYLTIISGLFISLHCDRIYPILKNGLSNFEIKLSNNLIPVFFLLFLSTIIPLLSLMVNNLKAFNYLRLEIHDATTKGDISADIYDWSRFILPPKILNFQLDMDNSDGVFTFTVSDLKIIEKKVNDIHFYKPYKGYQCWNAELPCSQRLTYDSIRLRDPEGGIGKGFVRTKIE